MDNYFSLFFHKYIMDTNNKIEFIKTTTAKLENGDVQAAYPEEFPYSFIHTQDENDNGTTDERLYIGEEMITDRLNVGDANLNSPTRKVGGLEASTIGALNQKSISQIILEMVRPDVVEPTVSTQASISISYSGSKLIEVGTNLPSADNISVTIRDGVWSDGTPYAGGHNPAELSINPSDWGEPAEEGAYTISGSVTFTEGGIPKDNFGTSYPGKQYHGGTKTSTSITIKAVNPIYINDGDVITDMVKHLVDYLAGKTFTVTIPAEVVIPEPVKFKVLVPEQFTTFTVMQYNPLTQAFDIPVPMVFVPGDTPMYERVDNSYTNTLSTTYQINLKK